MKVCLVDGLWGAGTDAKNNSGDIPPTPRNQNAPPPPNPPQGNPPQPQPTPIQTPIPLAVRGIEPHQSEIDGGGQLTITIHVQNEERRDIPYYPRLGETWSIQPFRESPVTIVCRIPPVVNERSVDLTFWREESVDAVNRVNSAPREFMFKDRSARKV